MDAQKALVRQYWDSTPCASLEVQKGLDYFQAHSRMRYAREPEILAFADFAMWKDRRVLEIGVGMGADFVQFKKAGASAIGVDLSPGSLDLARRNITGNNLTPILLNADAEELPFSDSSFDLVYSWGVLHHASKIEQALAEVHRVLRYGGECRLMLYHRRSLLALQCYLRYGLMGGRPFASVSHLIGTHIESPGTKAFTPREVKNFLRRFREVQVKPVMTAYDVRLGRRRFAPRWLLRLFPDQLGWFLLIRAQK